MNYYNKYLKYKNKYFSLKKTIGGSKTEEEKTYIGIEKEFVIAIRVPNYVKDHNGIPVCDSELPVYMTIVDTIILKQLNLNYVKSESDSTEAIALFEELKKLQSLSSANYKEAFENFMAYINIILEITNNYREEHRRMLKAQYNLNVEEAPYRLEVKNGYGTRLISAAIAEIENKTNNAFKKCLELFPFLKGFLIKLDDFGYYPKLLDLPETYQSVKIYDETSKQFIKKAVVEEDKTGSYHLNITLPYQAYVEATHDTIHTKLMIAIQFIEPLLLACFSSVTQNIFGDQHMNIENSLRLLKSSYKNFLSIDPTKYAEEYGDRIFSKDYSLLSKILTEFRIDDSPPYAEDFKKPRDHRTKIFGFEFRMLDLFPTEHLTWVLHLIFMLAEHINDLEFFMYYPIPTQAFNTPNLVQFIVDIFKEGWNTPVIKEYIMLITSRLGLKLEQTKENPTITRGLSQSITYHEDVGKYITSLALGAKINDEPTRLITESIITDSPSPYSDISAPSIEKRPYNCLDMLNNMFKQLATKYVDSDKFKGTVFLQYVTTQEELSALLQDKFPNVNGDAYNQAVEWQKLVSGNLVHAFNRDYTGLKEDIGEDLDYYLLKKGKPI